jgi:methylenetetrahydrofolate reductase (NADPH)
MHIAEVIDRDTTTFSFEFFPPKTEQGWAKMFERTKDFERLEPSFVSVTYGAGGSTRERTHELVVRLRRETALDAIPHLTCTGHGRETVRQILERYAEAGVSNILAIRGDPPQDALPYDHAEDDLPFASDLIRYIHEFNERHLHPDQRGFGVISAGFPEGHPETPNRITQMEHLKAKVDVGVDCIITQMFFDNRAFYDWCERCEIYGIDVPKVAGIMPITSIKGMKRMADLAAGTNFPAPLQRAVYRCQDDPEAVKRVGVHWATEQCRDLLDNGVRGIHFYTLNQSDATKQIYQTLGAKTSATLRETPNVEPV